MNVLAQVIEKISTLKRHNNCTDNLELKAETQKVALLLPDLQKYKIKAVDGTSYTIYLIPESDPSDNELNRIASLAGFYNSRFVFECLKYYQVKVPIGTYRFFVRKRSEDLPDNIFVSLVIWWPTVGQVQKSVLTLDDTYKVAETLSILHARGYQRPALSSRDIVNENHDLVLDFLTKHLRNNFEHFLHLLFTHNHSHFLNSDKAHQTIHALYESFTSFKECSDCDDGLVKVLCHGNLCAENLRFNSQNDLTAILNWEHSSFGHIGLDLTYLMVSSLTATDRRQNYLKVLRHYYYSLVDKHAVPFKLYDLKLFYRQFLKYSVFFNLFGLVFTLESENVDDQDKCAAVQRWEQVLYEAYDVETSDYVSDNEDIRIL